MKGTFRVAGELAQFYGELDALKKTKKTLLVWQTNAEGNRATYDGIIKSYLANKVETVINIGIENAENMATDLPIFIYEDDKGILFKGEFKHYMNGLLKIKADEKVFLKERRSCQRINFHYTSVYVNVQFSQKLDFHKIKLKDISIQGFSIFTTETMA
ncbi:MAG: hypothetical protein HON90_17625, partial [Halobacteriovoraceae bacterium]|nr:hypothetical protein [Halobacteriovoraceae bacterium]